MHNLVKDPTNSTSVSYFKLPYIEYLPIEIKTFDSKYYCINTNIKFFFLLFKFGVLFSVKESMPKYLRPFVVYRFTYLGCNISYIGETTDHLTTRI